MFLQDLAHGLLRRWYMVLIGIMLTAAAGLFVFRTVPVTFEATSSLVLIPPVTTVSGGSNPYLYMGGLDQALSVLTVRMNSPVVADPILGKDPELSYAMGKDMTTAGPIMVISAAGDTEARTLNVLNQIVKSVPSNMKILQDQLQIPADTRITVMTIVTDTTAKAVNKKQIRSLLTVIAGGLALTLLLTALFDRAFIRLRKWRTGRRRARSRIGRGAPMERPRVDGGSTPPHPGGSQSTGHSLGIEADASGRAGRTAVPQRHEDPATSSMAEAANVDSMSELASIVVVPGRKFDD